MKITFICVGAIKKACIKEGVQDYLKRIGKYSPVDVAQVKEESASIKMPREDVLKKEGERILKKLKPGDYVAVLGDKGREFSSGEFSAFIGGLMSGGKKGVSFVIGGAFGLHKSVYERADAVVALSRMTLPHEMAMLVLSEQVYRAFTIIRNEPYSH